VPTRKLGLLSKLMKSNTILITWNNLNVKIPPTLITIQRFNAEEKIISAQIAWKHIAVTINFPSQYFHKICLHVLMRGQKIVLCVPSI